MTDRYTCNLNITGPLLPLLLFSTQTHPETWPGISYPLKNPLAQNFTEGFTGRYRGGFQPTVGTLQILLETWRLQGPSLPGGRDFFFIGLCACAVAFLMVIQICSSFSPQHES